MKVNANANANSNVQRLSMHVPENYFEGRPEELLEGSPVDATVLVRLEICRAPGSPFLHRIAALLPFVRHRTPTQFYIQQEECTLRRFVYSFQNRGQLFSLYDLYIDGKRCMASEMAEILTEATGYKVSV